MNWFYEFGGQQQGPVSDSDLDRLVAEGKVTPETLIWREGQAGWLPLREARPVGGGPISAFPGTPAVVSADAARCDSCGKVVPRLEIVQIADRNICSTCKPAVLQQIQQGAGLPLYAGGERTGPAWEHRAELGLIQAAWQTIKSVLNQPSDTFSHMKRDGGLTAPLLYMTIVGGIGGAVGILYQFVVQLATGAAAHAQTGNAPLAMFSSGIVLVVLAVLMPVLVAIGSFINAGILHLSLMVCSGAKQPFEATYRAYCYAAASAYSLQVIPVCGALVAGIWGLVATCIAIARTHEITTGRAVIAVLLPAIVCCGLVAVIFASVFGIAAAAAGHSHGSP